MVSARRLAENDGAVRSIPSSRDTGTPVAHLSIGIPACLHGQGVRFTTLRRTNGRGYSCHSQKQLARCPRVGTLLCWLLIHSRDIPTHTSNTSNTNASNKHIRQHIKQTHQAAQSPKQTKRRSDTPIRHSKAQSPSPSQPKPKQSAD